MYQYLPYNHLRKRNFGNDEHTNRTKSREKKKKLAKAKKKTKAKRDEQGRFVKDEADLDTPSLMIALIKPILFKFLGSKAVKELVVKLLEAYRLLRLLTSNEEKEEEQ